ncbi:hypothetical protein F2Q70_00026826 [Brassica cretica]|uniref:Uncharacterized protein n=2 Tax=Brassica cretica TaxID=69181 RepID=A0A8S9LDM9_BRACR|nr:hypothetical protein F2Q68_00026391 [Brassica cretica]KAF2604157.1 hypothetical protein F2Q70_00026826 [Brassica cretica]KAF3582305.1 hypothetical protein DY000_02032712 [Brassica cretica]
MVDNMVVVENCIHMVEEETCTQPLVTVSNMVVVEEKCIHTVVEEICSRLLVMGNSMLVAVMENCKHLVVEECCILPSEMVNMTGVVASYMYLVHTQQPYLP